MKMVYVLFAAIAAAAAVGGARSLAGPAPSTPTPSAIAAESEAAGGTGAVAAENGEAPDVIEGDVLEVIEVPSYSYLRLGPKGSAGQWVAVATAGLGVGDHARIRGGMKMTNFPSKSLNRTFPVIYFGSLDTGPAPTAAGRLPPGHPPTPGTHANGADPGASGADPQAAMASAHAPLGAVDVKAVDRAQGPNGKTVAELIAQRTQLAGKKVRLHATVVKATPGILGHTYLHLRDGSGDAAAGTHDVAVTTTATPAVGDTILIEGVLALDRDIGAGYKFPTIVEDATVVPAR